MHNERKFVVLRQETIYTIFGQKIGRGAYMQINHSAKLSYYVNVDFIHY